MRRNIGASESYGSFVERYMLKTQHLDMFEVYAPFLRRLRMPAQILDAGCGCGRDAEAFRNRGFGVTAVESSPALAERAAHRLGAPVQVRCFRELDFEEQFDGAWAFATLMRVEHWELGDVLARLVHALKPWGTLFTAFLEDAPLSDADERICPGLNSAGFEALVSICGAELTFRARGRKAPGRPSHWTYFMAQKSAGVASAAPLLERRGGLAARQSARPRARAPELAPPAMGRN